MCKGYRPGEYHIIMYCRWRFGVLKESERNAGKGSVSKYQTFGVCEAFPVGITPGNHECKGRMNLIFGARF